MAPYVLTTCSVSTLMHTEMSPGWTSPYILEAMVLLLKVGIDVSLRDFQMGLLHLGDTPEKLSQ